VAIGYKSPKLVSESLMLPCLVTASGPALAVNVPFRSVLLRRSRKNADLARKPEAHPAFVG
jgi:hypothetical protein